MRIPSGVTDQYVYFVAVDATDFTTRETGLSSFTVYRSRNGGAAAAMTTPTINETDSTNMPGVYELLLDEDMTIDSGDDEQEMVFHITHAGMAPVSRAVTLYRSKITAGNTLGVESDGDLTKVNTLDGHTPQTADHTAGIADIPTVSEFNARTIAAADYFDPAADTVATVTDVTTKTGYSLSTAGILAIWHQLTSAIVTSGTIGKLLKDNIDAALSSLATATGLATAQADLDTLTGSDGATLATSQPNYAPNTTTPPTAGAIADAVLDEALSGHTTVGTLGKAVADVEADTNELQTDWADGGRLDLILDQILADTGTDGVVLSTATINSIADGLLDRADGVEPASDGTERTVREALRIILSAAGGKSSNGGKTFRDLNDSKDRITATVDGSYNRTAVTYDDT